jgi:hypothetical protein
VQPGGRLWVGKSSPAVRDPNPARDIGSPMLLFIHSHKKPDIPTTKETQRHAKK